MLLCVAMFVVPSWALVLPPSPMSGTEAGLNKLLEYQIFGADKITAGHDLELSNPKGYFGSNKQIVAVGGNWKISPTTLIGSDGGGAIVAADFDGNGVLTFNGKVIVNGSMMLINQNTFKDTLATWSAPSGGTLTEPPKGIYSKSSWPDHFTSMWQSLQVPSLDWTQCHADDPSYPINSNINVSTPNAVALLDASQIIADTVVDYCLNNVTGNQNGYKVLVKHQPYQIVRVFVNGDFSFHNDNVFGVTTDGVSIISKDDYKGSLLVYVNGTFTGSGDRHTLMGSFMHPKPLALWQGTSLTGQLIAQEITVQNTLNGANFKYVPFNPPQLQPTISYNGGVQLTENDATTRTLIVSLDKPAIVPVSVDYSFLFEGVAPLASAADFDSIGLTGKLNWAVGQTTAFIKLKVKNDPDKEGTENLKLTLSNIDGAVFPGGATSVSVLMSILDNDDNLAPTSQNGSVIVTEDLPFAFKAGDFIFNDALPGNITFVSLTVATPPALGTLFIDNGNGLYDSGVDFVVTANSSLAVADIPKLMYLTPSNGNTATSFSFKVSDGLLESVSSYTMAITVTAVADTPSISAIANQTILEDQPTTALAFTIGDGDGLASATLSVSSNNLTLIPLANIHLDTLTPTSLTVTLTPATHRNGGPVTIKVIHSDGGLADTAIFTVSITPVNDAPSFTKGANDTVNENAGPQTRNWNSVRSAGPYETQTLSFLPTNNNNALFSTQPAVSSAGVLTYTPAANKSGVATVTIKIKDSGLTANGGVDTSATQTFTITVVGVNGVPSFTVGADQSVNEDAGLQTVNGWVPTFSAGAGETSQTVSFTATAADPSLFSGVPLISPSGVLTYTPAANAFGTTNVTVFIKDDGGTANGGVDQSATKNFTITVKPVNDAPSYTSGSNVTVPEDTAATYSKAWASTLSMGPANEVLQTDTFKVTNNASTLFSTQPSISAAGLLTFKPALNANGVATVTVRFKDSGGTLNGGVDSVGARTFTINITPVNDAPVAVNDNAPTAQDVAKAFSQATLVANDTDVDGDIPVFASLVSISDSNGVSSIVGSNVVFTPVALFSGVAKFQYVVSDGHGGLDTGSVYVSVAYTNTPPTLGAIVNDTINQGVQLSVAGTGADTDAGDILTYSLVTAPTAMAINASTGLITWTPTNADVQVAAYTVTVHVKDKFNASPADRTFTVTVNNVNDAPVLATILAKTIEEDSLFTVTASATDADLIVPTVTEVLTYSLVSPPTNMTINATTGVISWTPTNAQVGVHSISVVVRDAGTPILRDTVVFTLTVTNVNDAPTLATIADKITFEDALFTVTALGSDVDLGDTKTYSLPIKPAGMAIDPSTGVITWTSVNADVDPTPYAVTVRVTDSGDKYAETSFTVEVRNVNDAPVFGVVADDSTAQDDYYSLQLIANDVDQAVNSNEALDFVLLSGPTGLVMDASGKLTWTPGSSDVGTHVIKVMVADFAGLSDTVTFNLTVTNVNDAPVIATIEDQTTLEDSTYSFTVVGTDPDVDDTTLTYSFVAKPTGMILNPTTGVITWTPDNSKVGDHIITVRATDAGGLYVDKTFTLTVENVNDAPTLTNTTMTIAEDAKLGAIVGKVTGTDIDAGSIITYEIVGSDSKFRVSVEGTITVVGVLDYETAKAETLWVAVTDGIASDTARIIVSVTNVKEVTLVEIIKVASADSTWARPDTVWTNDSLVDITWTHDGTTQIDRVPVHSGINVLIKEWKSPGKDTYGRDTVIVLVNRQDPEVTVILPPDRPEPKPNTVIEDPLLPVELTDEGDTIYFINDGERTIFARVVVVGKDMKRDTIIVKVNPELSEGINTVTYTYTDIFGNSSSGTIPVFLDLTPPVVRIVKPADSTQTTQFVSPVQWTVDGLPMDTLNQQSLVVGWNAIIRSYRDRAGNEASDTVWIKLKDAKKNIHISLEEPMVALDHQKVAEYYAINPPKDGEFFALSIVNTQSGREEEKQYGMGSSTKKGDDKEPYPGLVGKHLGPTLRIEVKLPAMGGVDAAGKLRGGDMQSIMEPDGRIALTEGAGEDRELVSLSDYIDSYCLEGAFKELSPGEMRGASLYKAKVYIEVMIYDAIGQFVDNMKVVQEIDSPNYLSDGGILTGFLEIKPRKDKGLQSQTGRSYGTGAYVVRGTVRSVSTLICDTPAGARGSQVRYSDDILQAFGFRRDAK
jgi:hypothetical protein